MRVIAGKLGGRTFDAPRSHRTHPMSERMRGALFNTLGDIEDLIVLDAFGGSGALSIEAISRGAKKSTVIEIDKTAHNIIISNLKNLGLEDFVKAVRANVSSWSDNNPDEQFDLLLCNPPFDKINLELIKKLTRHIKKDGLLVLSWPTNISAPEIPQLDLVSVREKNYGDAQLIFYRRV
jgi:16S rRNA (guanine966-N2)-methyltransferase